MTVNIPTSLGPSWMPKLGGLLAIFAAAFEAVPDTAPGASYVKPWVPFINAVAIGLVGLTARQNNVPSEKVGVAPSQKNQNEQK